MTRDYDFWLPAGDAEVFNRAVASLGLVPNRTPEEARRVGRYVLERGARAMPTTSGCSCNSEMKAVCGDA